MNDEVVAPGPPRHWHVSEAGRDGREGSAEQPVHTIQFAVDRARPGHTVIIHPGLYPDPVRFTKHYALYSREARVFEFRIACAV